MAYSSRSWMRTCRCGKKYRISRADIIEGVGRYCSNQCLDKAITDQKGTFLTWYKLPDSSGVYRAEVRLHKGNCQYATKNKYTFVGDKDQAVGMVWGFLGGKVRGRRLPSAICWDDIERLWIDVFHEQAEAMYQTFLAAGEEEVEMLHFMAQRSIPRGTGTRPDY